jgi:cell division protein ZapA (FtsZ GTPase activity inhibitor)
MAIELDATADQQVKIANIAKAAIGDLRPLREKAQAARTQAVTLLTAPTIDHAAIERLRAEQIVLAETASKRITGIDGCGRRAQSRTAPEGGRLGRVQWSVGALASRLMDTD